jgi:hypothetical protein
MMAQPLWLVASTNATAQVPVNVHGNVCTLFVAKIVPLDFDLTTTNGPAMVGRDFLNNGGIVFEIIVFNVTVLFTHPHHDVFIFAMSFGSNAFDH